MGHFNSYKNDLLDAEYDNTATGSLALGTNGATTYARPFKLHLATNNLTASTTPTEPSGGSYAAANLPTMSAASAGSKASSASVTYSNMPACTWNDVYVASADATPKNMNFAGAALARTVNAGDSVLVTSLTGTE